LPTDWAFSNEPIFSKVAVQDANRNVRAADIALDDVAFVALGSGHWAIRVVSEADGI
jgi:hypothetical protein